MDYRCNLQHLLLRGLVVLSLFSTTICNLIYLRKILTFGILQPLSRHLPRVVKNLPPQDEKLPPSSLQKNHGLSLKRTMELQLRNHPSSKACTQTAQDQMPISFKCWKETASTETHRSTSVILRSSMRPKRLSKKLSCCQS